MDIDCTKYIIIMDKNNINLDVMDELSNPLSFQDPNRFNPFSAIKFGMWLTGLDEDLVVQLYDDFCNSGDIFKNKNIK